MYLKIHLNLPPIYKEPPAENARQSIIDKIDKFGVFSLKGVKFH